MAWWERAEDPISLLPDKCEELWVFLLSLPCVAPAAAAAVEPLSESDLELDLDLDLDLDLLSYLCLLFFFFLCLALCDRFLEPTGDREREWDCCEWPIIAVCTSFTNSLYTLCTVCPNIHGGYVHSSPTNPQNP